MVDKVDLIRVFSMAVTLYLRPVMDGPAENIANFLHKTRKFTFFADAQALQ